MRFIQQKTPFPDIRVITRSGDAPCHACRQMIRRPSTILIASPQSPHLAVSSNGGRSMRGRIRTVIPDENHAVVGIKRKTLLIMAVDRLVPLCGECQRIALSATVNPEGDVAGVIGGFMIAGDKAGPRYIPLKVARCREHQQHRDGIHVRIPDAEKRPSLKVLRLGFDTIVAPRSLVRYRRTGT